MKISEKQILDLLQKVIDPVTKLNIISLGMVSHILIDQENNVKFSLEIEKESLEKRKSLLLNCKELLESVNGINKVTIVFTNKSNIAKKTIVVGSGKGGVGKSTIALNIAVGLAEKGYKVAIVDADIYGPSIPHMLGITGKPEIKGGKIIPFEKYGIQSISIGYFLPTDSAVVWRGPMLIKSLQQMILGTSWNDLDYMIIDTPPGTGDVHISLAKICTISSAIVISTPQELSLIDATRAIDMFKKLKIPILGVVENMSYLVDGKGIKNYLFGKAGGKRLAENFSLKLLGEVPLDPAISSNCDAGFPSILNKEIGIHFLQILNAIS